MLLLVLLPHYPSPNAPRGLSSVHLLNIARGTTDPEIDSVTWIKFSNNMAPLALDAIFTTRWLHLHKLQIWPTDGTIWIGSKFGHQVAKFAINAMLLPNLIQVTESISGSVVPLAMF